ncbi:MAG: HpaII family restriction endonuclease [Clostridia bacterium]|nr:HpaII family restriction endonuclease [Clostridia bacterium]
MPGVKGKNKGEWSEIYIFFKLMTDRKVYVADKDMNKLKDVFLNIISIIREESAGKEYRYYTGDNIVITLNGTPVKTLDASRFSEKANRVWEMITGNKGNTTFSNDEIRAFLESIFIHNISAPAQKKNDFFGGTKDIVLDTVDYRSGVSQIMGFSCKSDIDAASTLFNASGDNTNFEYELSGDMNDEKMDFFNSMYNKVVRKGTLHHDVAIGKRMDYLKSQNITVNFVNTARDTARHNLIRCGGLETPTIVAEMLKYYFYDKSGSDTSVDEAIKHLAEYNPIEYDFDNLYDTYHMKVANLLYFMFTGLRFSKPWNGKSDVSGGYIVVKRCGDIVAFHSCIADEFKDFLIDKLKFEAPSCSRHDYMSIYKKDDGKYYLKFALQFRFKLKK